MSCIKRNKRKVRYEHLARTIKKGKKKGKQALRVPLQSDNQHRFEMPVAPIIKEVTIPEMIIVSDLAQK